MQIKFTETDEEIARCFPVMLQLRPHLIESEFVERIRVQERQNYRLAFVERENKVCAVAGLRVNDNLSWGRFMYIDDLVADETERSQGLGSQLFEWCRDYALRMGCSMLLLDSGVQRFDAHRFYLGKRMSISSHRFSMGLK